MGIGTFALVVAVVPLATKSATTRTRTRSEAALLPHPQLITEEYETPTGPPVIYLVDHFFGKIGDAVLVHGENLGGLHENSSISLAGKKITKENLVSWTGNYIEFIVPTEARSGKLEVNILGKTATWEGIFFVTNNTTKAELKLEGVNNMGSLKAVDIEGGKELLLWLLVINQEGSLKLEAIPGIKMNQKKFNLPIGTVYEVKLTLNDKLTKDSQINQVELLKIIKSSDQLVGVARAELTTINNQLIPIQLHPLFVSF